MSLSESYRITMFPEYNVNSTMPGQGLYSPFCWLQGRWHSRYPIAKITWQSIYQPIVHLHSICSKQHINSMHPSTDTELRMIVPPAFSPGSLLLSILLNMIFVAPNNTPQDKVTTRPASENNLALSSRDHPYHTIGTNRPATQ